MALAVIIIETIKFINFITAISLTMINDGVQGSKAFLYMMCCRPQQLREKVKNRRIRLRTRREHQVAVGEENSLQTQSDDFALTEPDL